MTLDLSPDAPAPSPVNRAAERRIAAEEFQHHKPDGLRDTIDSIIVAFILAFVFRAFIVEAFVIPTGSMAPSLYGMHGQHRCANCAYSFAYGIREPGADGDNVFYPGTLTNRRGERESFNVRCPNCTWNGDGNLINTTDNPVTANSGDRILVMKWPYDVGGAWLGPQRWDVCVFKNPQEGEVNFIKRLLGLPGEVLQIIHGDVYTAPLDKVPSDIRDALTLASAELAFDERLSPDQHKRLASILKIQRKTRVAQDSLWMLHYDHDYIPRRTEQDGVARFYQPPYWSGRDDTARRAWDATTPAVRFKPVDAQRQWLDLLGRPIQDEYGYNNVKYTQDNQSQPRPVGDVRLSFVLFPQGNDGELTLLLTKGRDQFQARISADGKLRLERFNRTIRDGFWEELAKGEIRPLVAGHPRDIEIENLDYRVSLRIDGEEVLATTDAQYKPDVVALLKPPYEDGRGHEATIAIAAQSLSLEIRHLKVERDVFYRSDHFIERGSFHGRPGWGTALNPILLRDSPSEFFCCGDNSPQSKDSRLWVDVCPLLRARTGENKYHYGTVPGDQMIGRAFFVYWPSGLRFSKRTMAVIPNVGRMRLIR